MNLTIAPMGRTARRVPATLWTLLAISSALAPTGAIAHPAHAIGPYIMASKQQEVALARSAAPPSISGHASVMVLGAHGYVTAVRGSNGFVCLVVRSWARSVTTRATGFWNPRFRAPFCFNAAGAQSMLPPYLSRTQWALAGSSRKEIAERAKAAWAAGKFAEPKPGALCYMMSRQGTWSKGGPWRPHVMFYLPHGRPSSWGANLQGVPILAQAGAHITTFFVLVPFWSDGAPAPLRK
jgi:hypothetical protein